MPHRTVDSAKIRFVLSDPHVRFYAGYPLTDSDGYALGTLCVMDRTARKLTKSQRQSLKLLGDMATDLIVEHRQKQELNYFEDLFTLSNDLIFVAGSDGFLKKINPAFHHILGWDEAYLLRMPFFELVHPDDLQATKLEIKHLADGKSCVNFTHRFRSQNGTYRHLQWVATPEPTTGYLFAVARDVTDEKKKEILLYQSETKFRSFFENSQGLMCTHDLAGTLMSVNTAGAHALGYQPEELIGHRLHEITPQPQHEELDAYLQTIQKTGRANGLMQTRHKDGSLHIWLFANILEKELTGISYIIGNAIDITKRHQLEVDLKRTKQMLEQTNEVARIGTWEVDVIRQTVYWSTVTKAIHEVPDDFLPTLDAGIAYFKGVNNNRIVEAMDQAINQGTAYDLELEIITAANRPIWVRIVGTPEFQAGVCIRVYGTINDIHEKRTAELELLNEKLRLAAFVEHAPAAVAMFDRTVSYLAVSRRWLEVYDLSKSVIGLSHYEVFPTLSDSWKAIFDRCINGAVEKKR